MHVRVNIFPKNVDTVYLQFYYWTTQYILYLCSYNGNLKGEIATKYNAKICNKFN